MPAAMAQENDFAAKLKRLREGAGLTQRQLAERAGVTLSNLRQMEQGVNDNPRRSILLALSKALGVSLDSLAGEG